MKPDESVTQTARFPYEQTGGYSAGLGSATWPFGTLVVSPGQLELQTIANCYTFPSECITRLSFYTILFMRGLRIEHSIAEYPLEIIFWTFKFRELQERLHEAGFSVSDRMV